MGIAGLSATTGSAATADVLMFLILECRVAGRYTPYCALASISVRSFTDVAAARLRLRPYSQAAHAAASRASAANIHGSGTASVHRYSPATMAAMQPAWAASAACGRQDRR